MGGHLLLPILPHDRQVRGSSPILTCLGLAHPAIRVSSTVLLRRGVGQRSCSHDPALVSSSICCLLERAKGKGGDLSLDDATTQQTSLFSHTHALRASFPGSPLLCGSGEGQGQLSCFDDLGASFLACHKWQGVKSCISPSPMSPHRSRGLALLLSCL